MIKPKYSYGDRLRRQSDGSILVVRDIREQTYCFDNGGTALISDQDCYVLMEPASGFFVVTDAVDDAPLADYIRHGFESRRDFVVALRRLIDRWHGRIGEVVDHKNGFLLLRFYDTPGNRPDQAWLPVYLLCPVRKPTRGNKTDEEYSELTRQLDEVYGFD